MTIAASLLMQTAEKHADELRLLRRDFHRHPELAFQEYRTTRVIREYLCRLPEIKLWDLDCPTGVIAELPGRKKRPVVLRADIDALPIQELNTHDYASENPGIMHACGHDGHIAALLGAARLLADCPDRVRPVRFLFQPAEEVSPSGAPAMIKAGALRHAECIFGFHLNATSDFGLVGFYDGAVMAGGLTIRIEIQGKGGHSAYPEKCINPILCANDILSSLAGIKDAIHPMYGCNIVPVRIQSGDGGSRIPETALLEIRFKYLDSHAERIFRRELKSLIKGCSIKHHAECRLEFIPGYPISFNAPALGTEIVRPAAQKLGLPLSQIAPSMGSDDFAWYAQKIPAYYMTFGIRKGQDFPIAHTPYFDFDEEILPVAAAQLAACAVVTTPGRA